MLTDAGAATLCLEAALPLSLSSGHTEYESTGSTVASEQSGRSLWSVSCTCLCTPCQFVGHTNMFCVMVCDVSTSPQGYHPQGCDAPGQLLAAAVSS